MTYRKFALFGDDGALKGLWDERATPPSETGEEHPAIIDAIAIGAIEIAGDLATDLLENQGRRRLVKGEVKPYTPPATDADVLKQGRVDAVQDGILLMGLSHENRIRALEGQRAVTLEQFKGAIKALL